MRRLRRLTAGVLVAVGATVAFVLASTAIARSGWSAQGSASRTTAQAHAASAGRPFTASVSYDQTNNGKIEGTSDLGVVGHGHFSAKLGVAAQLDAMFVSAATGVPLLQIARGGTYIVRRNELTGKITGMVVAKFKTNGLGVACVSYTQHQGHYTIGAPSVPQILALKTVGGTGKAARWYIKIAFTQNSVTGITVEHLSGKGTEQASLGPARGLTAACRKVKAL